VARVEAEIEKQKDKLIDELTNVPEAEK